MASPTYITVRDYQIRAEDTALYPGKGEILGLAYVSLGLTGESGEVAELVKKLLRDDHGVMTEERRAKIKAELGDILWYLSQVATEASLALEDIAEANLEKLASRKIRGVLQGTGDER